MPIQEAFALGHEENEKTTAGGSTSAPAGLPAPTAAPAQEKKSAALVTSLHGFCMALADSVPGVSGGTIAFLLGFYERLLTAVHDIFCRERTRRRAAGAYLLKLGAGWAAGMCLATMALARIFEAHICFMSSVLLGLTAASVPLVMRSECETLKKKPRAAVFLPIGIAAVVSLVAARGSVTPWVAVDFLKLAPDSMLYLFLSGALAISAMILPGISGSTLLLVFGVYLPSVQALQKVMQAQFAYLPALLLLAAGAVAGLILFIRALRNLLKRRRPEMIYLILGLMIGSLYAIWMGPTTLPAPQAALTFQTLSAPGILLGCAILFALEWARRQAEKAQARENR